MSYHFKGQWCNVKAIKIKHRDGCFIKGGTLSQLTTLQQEFLATVEAAIHEHELEAWPRPRAKGARTIKS